MIQCYACQKQIAESEIDDHLLEHVPKVDEPTEQQVSYSIVSMVGGSTFQIGRTNN